MGQSTIGWERVSFCSFKSVGGQTVIVLVNRSPQRKEV